METENLKALRKLRMEDKAIKARIETIKPLAIEEAKNIQPKGGLFEVEGLGEFVLDKIPVLDIAKSNAKDAVEYRKLGREQKTYKDKAAELTKKMKGYLESFKQKFGKKATEFTYNIKCQGLD